MPIITDIIMLALCIAFSVLCVVAALFIGSPAAAAFLLLIALGSAVAGAVIMHLIRIEETWRF